jgi:hypothetical protein
MMARRMVVVGLGKRKAMATTSFDVAQKLDLE